MRAPVLQHLLALAVRQVCQRSQFTYLRLPKRKQGCGLACTLQLLRSCGGPQTRGERSSCGSFSKHSAVSAGGRAVQVQWIYACGRKLASC